MQLIQTSPSRTGFIALLTFERRSWLAAVVAAFCGGFAIGNGHTTTTAVEHISDQLGQTQHKVAVVQKEAACEHKRANKTAAVAGQAILSNRVEDIPTPQFKDIPSDYCPHPAAIK